MADTCQKQCKPKVTELHLQSAERKKRQPKILFPDMYSNPLKIITQKDTAQNTRTPSVQRKAQQFPLGLTNSSAEDIIQ